MRSEATETSAAPVASYPHWTIDLLAKMPQIEGERYELIQGKLYVTTQPHTRHQITCSRISTALNNWSETGVSGFAIVAPGVIYANDEAVVSDVVWVSAARFTAILGTDGKLHGSPELVVEVLSPGKANAERDREVKLDLYSRRGVLEYWIADWPTVTIEVYRATAGVLQLVQTLQAGETLSSPLLPGFAVSLERLLKLEP